MYVERLYTFKCPICKKVFTYDQPAEPLCDGPGDVKVHEPAVMWRISVKDKELGEKLVSAEEGEARSKGTLLTPEALVSLKARIRGKLWMPKDKINPWTKKEMRPEDE